MPDPFSTSRRITTGVDARGKAVIVADEVVERDKGALVLWQTDTPTVMGDPNLDPVQGWWPPPGGVRVSYSTTPPLAVAKARNPDRYWPDINDASGFHASRSVDVIVMISGSIWLELDDGVEVELKAGDSLIQNGTRHRWHNRSDDWALMAVVIVGAHAAP